MNKIKNTSQLLSGGATSSREKIVSLLEAMWDRTDSYKLIKNLVHIEEDILSIGDKSWNIKNRHIYLFGAGKACNAMAMAVGEILGDRLTEGVISVKIAEETDTYHNTKCYVGGHPLPNAEGMKAAEDIISMIKKGQPEDLFISVISGGSSALLTCPVDGISLEDEIAAQDLLLRSGAKIEEINAVRRHISKTNGGRLAELVLDKGCELINLIVGDGVGVKPTVNYQKPCSFFGTPVAPDRTTLEDAKCCIRNYGLEDKMPDSIMNFLEAAGPEKETPKTFSAGVTHYVLNNVPDSCEAAVEAAKEMGIPSMVLTTFIEGESREAGNFFAALAREIQANGRPLKAPCFVFCSGETTTKVEDDATGIGGPSHELAMGFALAGRYTQNAAIASVDTEGTDGTTKFAGAISDSETMKRMEELNLDIYDTLRNHDCGTALEKLGDSIFTGNTGTNLCDFNVLYVPATEE